ncbi:MAG: hypothetical protein ACR2M0_00345 [Chloroflexia bacterium]
MTLSRLIRWSGMAFIVSGILLIVVTLLHPDVLQTTFARAILDTPWWVHIHVLFFAYALLGLLGAAGIYLSQVRETGALGLVGFLLVFVGLIAVAGLALFEAFVMPPLATSAPATLSLDGPIFTNPLTYVGFSLDSLYPLGFVLLGIATLRAGVMSRWGALLLTLGVPLTAVFEGLFVPFLGIASVLVLAAGQAWLGYDLWAARDTVPRGERLASTV